MMLQDLLNESLDAKRAEAARTLLKTKFRPPFSQSGNWVNDSRGTSVCEMTPEVAKAIATALNAFVTGT